METKTKNKKFKLFDKTKNQNVEYDIEQIIDEVKNGDSVLSSKKLIAISVTNAAGNVFVNKVLEKQKPLAYFYNSDHMTIHAKSGIRHHSFTLIYELSEELSKTEALKVGNEIIHEIKQQNQDIDIHGGSLEAKTEITGTTYNHRFAKLVLPNSLEVDVESIFNKRDKESDFKELQDMMNKRMKKAPYKAFEFVKMAEFLNDKKVYLDGHDEVEREHIIEGILNSIHQSEYDQKTALEIIKKADKEGLSDSEYLAMLPQEGASGKSIGTFIYYAREMGYKRGKLDEKSNGVLNGEQSEPITKIENEVIEIENRIPLNEMFKIINDSKTKSVMIEAPTGSGKTYSMAHAIKLYTSIYENVFAIIASPTIPLVMQTAATGEFGKGVYGRASARSIIKDSIKRGDRTISTTFDRASQVVNEIKSMHKNSENPVRFIIIVDEGHKEFTDIDYRAPAIKSLFNLRDKELLVDKFVSLSGTTLPIVETAYDKKIIFKQTEDVKVFDNFSILKYNKSTEYEDVVIASIVEQIKKGLRVLAFIQSRKSIERIQKVLNDTWKIKTASIKAERGNENRSKTYKHIVEEKAFPEGVQVVLSTSVISDGVSIQNKTGEYATIIAPHYNKSRIFDLSLNKQMSHRLRTKFDNLTIPLLFTSGMDDERVKNDIPFDLEAHYEWLVFKAEKFAEYTRLKFKDSLDLYKPSVLEISNGLHPTNDFNDDFGMSEKEFYRYAVELERHLEANPNRVVTLSEASVLHALHEKREQLFSIDYRFLRKKALDDMEAYYSYYPNAFIPALEEILGEKATVMSAYEELSEFESEKQAESSRSLQKMSEEDKEADEARADNLENVLTEEKYEHMRNIFFKYDEKLPGNHDAVINLSENMSVRHYKVLKSIIKYVINYDDAMTIIKFVKRDADINILRNRMAAISEINTFMSGGKIEAGATQIVLEKMVESFENVEYVIHAGSKCLTNGMVDELLDKLGEEISGVTKKEIRAVYNRFYRSELVGSRKVDGKSVRLRDKFRLVNLDDTAFELGISIESMKEIYEIY